MIQRGIELILDDSARDFLSERSHSAEYGARALIRELDRRVVGPLGESIAAGTFTAGDRVLCRWVGDELEFTASRASPGAVGSGRGGPTSGG